MLLDALHSIHHLLRLDTIINDPELFCKLTDTDIFNHAPFFDDASRRWLY